MADKIDQFAFPPLLGQPLKWHSMRDDYLAMLPESLPPTTSSSLLLLAASQAFLILVLGFTRRDSVLRIGFLLPTVMTCLLGLAIYSEHPVTSSAILMIIIPMSASSTLFQYCTLVLIRRWSFEDKQKLFPTSTPSRLPPVLDRLMFGLHAAYSFRHCGTPYEVGGVAQFKNNKTPTRAQFLFDSSVVVLANFIVMDFVSYFVGPEQNPAFAQSRVPLFSRLDEVTAAECFERMILVTLLYASNVAMLTIMFGVAGILAVGSGLSEPNRWKPTFQLRAGFPYSVRRFWSHFWHVSMKDRIYMPSKYLADDVLCLPKGSALRRYALIWFTFVASGLFHIIGELGAGVPANEDGSFFYYTVQAAAICAEDFVINLWNLIYKSDEKKPTPSWQLWFGKVWVFLWFSWVTPGWFYPTNRLTTGIPVFPFSPAKALLG